MCLDAGASALRSEFVTLSSVSKCVIENEVSKKAIKRLQTYKDVLGLAFVAARYILVICVTLSRKHHKFRPGYFRSKHSYVPGK